MNFIYAFLFAGFACVIAEIILDNTKLTPGHITSLFTVIGSILSCLGAYDWLIEKCGAELYNDLSLKKGVLFTKFLSL